MDLKAVSLGEATAAERRAVDAHVKACGACREELSRLQLTFASLGALRDEEIPKRIAFVSDPVFEPGWWQKLWHSGPQLGFASAGLLAGALVFHAVYPSQPAATPVVPQVIAAAAPQGLTEEQVQKRIDAALAKAEERQQKMVAASEKRHELDRQGLLLAVEEQNTMLTRRMNQYAKVTAGLN